ncbi:hypothetical protein PMI04_001385 [Sphingobium sp. AP49]|uniref:hypothetical protein n=1 Tax=Sphingobium sp. AP49 TaxID=1144307 RepID=UPI001EE66400|nr:hypothetical protein [Sphingobium sp. AP49]WHO41242.1 hypothetical protein PMI04_001385 [Sphingobium sp. AP49]
MTEPIMPGCLTNCRKNMAHWPIKEVPCLGFDTVFFLSLKGVEAINIRLCDYSSRRRKIGGRWQAALRAMARKRAASGWVHSIGRALKRLS